MTPEFSVVVPVYNLEFYLARCLQSLVGQQCSGAFEIIAIDDGSTDDSPKIIGDFERAHPERFRSLRQKNGGHGAACNAGIRLARGQWLLFVDGDDFLEPGTLQRMYDQSRSCSADILMGNLRYHFSDHTEVFWPIEGLRQRACFQGAEKEKLFHNWATPCGRMYRRALFDDPDLRFCEGIIHADVSFSPKTYGAATAIQYVDEVWYEYDITRPDQSIKATHRKIMNVVPALNDAIEYFQKKGLFESHRGALEYYVLKHVVGWVPKVARLQDLPVREALGDLFSVADTYFPGWERGAALRALVGSRWKRRALCVSHATGFRILPWVLSPEWFAACRLNGTLKGALKAFLKKR